MNSSDRIAWSSVITITKFGAPFALGGRWATSSHLLARSVRFVLALSAARGAAGDGSEDRKAAEPEGQGGPQGCFRRSIAPSTAASIRVGDRRVGMSRTGIWIAGSQPSLAP